MRLRLNDALHRHPSEHLLSPQRAICLALRGRYWECGGGKYAVCLSGPDMPRRWGLSLCMREEMRFIMYYYYWSASQVVWGLLILLCMCEEVRLFIDDIIY